jgi:hypothetical protein
VNLDFRMPLVRWLVAVALVCAYFVVFPGDAAAVAAPLEAILRVTHAVSPFAYLLAAVGLVVWMVVRVWGAKGR